MTFHIQKVKEQLLCDLKISPKKIFTGPLLVVLQHQTLGKEGNMWLYNFVLLGRRWDFPILRVTYCTLWQSSVNHYMTWVWRDMEGKHKLIDLHRDTTCFRASFGPSLLSRPQQLLALCSYTCSFMTNQCYSAPHFMIHPAANFTGWLIMTFENVEL